MPKPWGVPGATVPVLGRKLVGRPFHSHCCALRQAPVTGLTAGVSPAASEGEGTEPAGPGLLPWQGLPGAPSAGLAEKAPSRAGGNLIVCPQIRNVGSCVFFS